MKPDGKPMRNLKIEVRKTGSELDLKSCLAGIHGNTLNESMRVCVCVRCLLCEYVSFFFARHLTQFLGKC